MMVIVSAGGLDVDVTLEKREWRKRTTAALVASRLAD
jgi:hypothetical protein